MPLATRADSKIKLRIKSRCNRMMVDGNIVNDPGVLLQNWAEHYYKRRWKI